MEEKNTNVTPAEVSSAETSKPKIKLNIYQIISIVCAGLLIAVGIGLGIYFAALNKAPERNPKDPLQAVLTLDNYNLITVGMTYDEVVDILGTGKRSTSSEAGQLNYIWEDNNDKYIIVTFSATTNAESELVPGIVIVKSQIGLIEETA